MTKIIDPTALYWFRPAKPSSWNLPTYMQHLHPFGIRMQKTSSVPVTYQMREGQLMAHIGEITYRPATGIIAIRPYEGTGQTELLMLAGCAEEAFENKPTKATQWRLYGSGTNRCWRCVIVVEVDADGSPEASLIGRHRLRIEMEALITSKAVSQW